MQLYGLIFQWDISKRDPLVIIEWTSLPYRSPKTIFTTMELMALIIIRARERLFAMAGQDFAMIYLLLRKECFDWDLQKSEDLQITLLIIQVPVLFISGVISCCKQN